MSVTVYNAPSLSWAHGAFEAPAALEDIYCIDKAYISQWPTLAVNEIGQITSGSYTGNFVLVAGAKWAVHRAVPETIALTSEAQGSLPAQTQKNVLEYTHQSVSEDATGAVSRLLNGDFVFVVVRANGKARVVGSPKWQTTVTVSQDQGTGSAGEVGTKVHVEATDQIPAPYITATCLADIKANVEGADDDDDDNQE